MNKGRTELYGRLYNYVAHVPGDVAECGVGKGKSLETLARLASSNGRQVWAFESWQEFPPLSEFDKDGTATALTEGLIVGDKQAVLGRLGSLVDCVSFVDGYFADTLPHFYEPLALVNLDVDLYAAYSQALLWLWPLLSPGGVMVFDEYHEDQKYPGAKRAVDRFLTTTRHELHEDIRWWARKP